MPVDVESELARLGTAWSDSVAHVDVAEVLERTMTTRSQPIDDMGDLPATSLHRMGAEPRSRRSGQRWLGAAACTALVMAGVVALAQRQAGGPEPAPTNPATTPSSLPIDTVAPIPPREPFVGVWVSTDTDGSSQTMDIVRSGTDEYEVVVRDDAASVACAGAAATMTGTGRLVTDVTLLIAQPVLTCDDGTVPAIGTTPQAEIADFTFDRDPVADELTDRFGVVWGRAGSNDEPIAPSSVTVPALASATSGGMWPQSTLDEVRAAQELADAGDPASTWQLDATLAAGGEPWGAEIFARFIEEELGWEEFISSSSFQGGYAGGEGSYGGILFIRCAPGQTNPLSPLYAEATTEVRGCAPTIDELTYETVSVNVSQPERRGPSGIWVVDRWEMLQSTSDPGSLSGLIYPTFVDQTQPVQQVAPPSDADVTALLQTFLRARVDGAGAEQYLLREPEESFFADREVPLLYATTSGASYERSEIQRLRGPVWPNGWLEYKVRLFAEGQTVVEQHFHVVRRDGQLGLVYGHASTDLPTTENGQSVAVPYGFLDGEVTVAATPPWYGEFGPPTVLRFQGGRAREEVVIAADPLPVETGCENGPAPADAEALARSIMANPEFETTDTAPVRIAGIDGLQIDGVVTAQWDTNWSLCYPMWITNAPLFRIRLYLTDHPGESAQVLTIAVIAQETDFDRLLEEATPIVESLEFHTR